MSELHQGTCRPILRCGKLHCHFLKPYLPTGSSNMTQVPEHASHCPGVYMDLAAFGWLIQAFSCGAASYNLYVQCIVCFVVGGGTICKYVATASIRCPVVNQELLLARVTPWRAFGRLPNGVDVPATDLHERPECTWGSLCLEVRKQPLT